MDDLLKGLTAPLDPVIRARQATQEPGQPDAFLFAFGEGAGAAQPAVAAQAHVLPGPPVAMRPLRPDVMAMDSGAPPVVPLPEARTAVLPLAAAPPQIAPPPIAPPPASARDAGPVALRAETAVTIAAQLPQLAALHPHPAKLGVPDHSKEGLAAEARPEQVVQDIIAKAGGAGAVPVPDLPTTSGLPAPLSPVPVSGAQPVAAGAGQVAATPAPPQPATGPVAEPVVVLGARPENADRTKAAPAVIVPPAGGESLVYLPRPPAAAEAPAPMPPSAPPAARPKALVAAAAVVAAPALPVAEPRTQDAQAPRPMPASEPIPAAHPALPVPDTAAARAAPVHAPPMPSAADPVPRMAAAPQIHMPAPTLPLAPEGAPAAPQRLPAPAHAIASWPVMAVADARAAAGDARPSVTGADAPGMAPVLHNMPPAARSKPLPVPSVIAPAPRPVPETEILPLAVARLTTDLGAAPGVTVSDAPDGAAIVNVPLAAGVSPIPAVVPQIDAPDAMPLGPVQGAAPSLVSGMPAVMAEPALLAQSASQQIVSAAAVLQAEPGGPIDIALDPPELGRVRLSLVEVNGAMTLSITAERPETADLMRRHLAVLHDEFARQGLDAPMVDISGGGQGGRQARDDDRPAQSAAPHHPIDIPAMTTRAGPAPGAATGLDLRL